MINDIAILVYPGCMGVEVFALTDLVLVANHLASNIHPGKFAPVRIRLVTFRPSPVALAGGIKVSAQRLVGKPDLLVVPGMDVTQFGHWDDRLRNLRQELVAIRRCHSSGIAMAGICIGSFVLAEAGVLEGRRATTAWPFVHEFQARYPGVQVERDAILLPDGEVITTGAVSSALDLGLHLIRGSLGGVVARATGKLSLIDGDRTSQRPYFDSTLIPQERALFSTRINQWLAARLNESYNLTVMANSFHTTARTVLRRYSRETGSTPLKWLQQIRIEKAKHLLERSSMSLSDVVSSVGYQDVATFSRLFIRETGQSPGHYRRQYLNKQRAA